MKNALFLVIILALFGCEKDNLNSLEKSEISENSSSRLINPISINKPNWVFNYVDTFDDSNVSDGNNGINHKLNSRQLYGAWAGKTWVRRSGTATNTNISPSYSQVNNSSYPNKLTFHSGSSALMLNHAISASVGNRYRVSFDTDPSLGDVNSDRWSSFMLDGSNNKNGYVGNMNFGFLIKSNGGIQVYQNGILKPGILINGSVQVSDIYHVVLDITPNELIVTINDNSTYQFVLNQCLVGVVSVYPYLGAQISTGSGLVTSFDDLVINTPKSNRNGHILYYGYYWPQYKNILRNDIYNHHSEIEGFTNFNFAEAPDCLATNRIDKNNVLQAKWQFWGDGHNLNTNWEILWGNLLQDVIIPKQRVIQSLYIFDEPFVTDINGNDIGVSVADYNQVLVKVQSDLNTFRLDIPVSAVFSPDQQYCTPSNTLTTFSQLNRISQVLQNLDFVGVDRYGIPFRDIKRYYLDPLETLILENRKKMILIPQSYPVTTCGFGTDESLAKLNWEYYNYALDHNVVVAIKNYGLWIETGATPQSLPIMYQVQKLIGKSITKY